MISYCHGNIALLHDAALSEIVEILDYLVENENDEALLRAYQASYAALQNIPFGEFRKLVQEKAALRSAPQPTAEETHNKVEHILNNTRWKEAT